MPFFKGPGFSFPLGRRTYIMGILNVTPDSFSDGGKFSDPGDAVEHALQMQRDGADILDIGAESTRPGHEPVPAEEEIARLLPVLRALSGKLKIPISVDTMKPVVAERAISEGAAIVNDVNGFLAEGMAETVANGHAAAVIMHPGFPPYPRGVAAGAREFLENAVRKAHAAGMPPENICLDPGFGFGKDYEQNLELVRGLEKCRFGEYALLAGISRKSMIGKATGETVPERRLAGTVAVHTICVMKGADILRVHDVAEAVQAARMADAIVRGTGLPGEGQMNG